MSDLLLSESDQAALRFVLAAEPVAGQPLPSCAVLERLTALVRCDAIGVALTDPNGYVVEEVERRNMPTELALLPFIESAFNPEALSSAKASGMWQFMPATGKDYDLKQNIFWDDRRDVLASTVIGSCMRPLASAARLSAAMPAATRGWATSRALTTTTAGPAPPGKACWIRV